MADNEGKIHRQVKRFQFEFDEADKDKSGCLSLDEVLVVLRKVGFRGSDDEGYSIFKFCDVNNDRKVTREEYTNALKDLPQENLDEFLMRSYFEGLDKDGSKRLSKEEIMNGLKGTEFELSQSEIQILTTQLSTGDGMVDYEEFLQVFGYDPAAMEMARIFNDMDKDFNGSLTRSEIMDGLKASTNADADKIADLLIALVHDDDGKITYREFLAVWQKENKK